MSRDGWAALPHGATGCLQFVIVVFPDHTHLLFRKKIRWEKLDRDRYRKRVESGVQGISMETVSLSDLNAKLQVFCDVIVDAAEKSAPCIRRGKKKRLWSDELKAASIMGKQVFFQWKKAGRPGPQHPLSIHCRVA